MAHSDLSPDAPAIINAPLAFDGYFNWYYPFKKSIPFDSPLDIKEEHAFNNMCHAIDYKEIVERVAIRRHGSFMPHGAVFKVTRDILLIGDVWAVDLSPLELQNATTKLTAVQGGSRHLTLSSSGRSRKPLKCKEGPAQLDACHYQRIQHNYGDLYTEQIARAEVPPPG